MESMIIMLLTSLSIISDTEGDVRRLRSEGWGEEGAHGVAGAIVYDNRRDEFKTLRRSS